MGLYSHLKDINALEDGIPYDRYISFCTAVICHQVVQSEAHCSLNCVDGLVVVLQVIYLNLLLKGTTY